MRKKIFRAVFPDQPFDHGRITFVPQVFRILSAVCEPAEHFACVVAEPEHQQFGIFGLARFDSEDFETPPFDRLGRSEPPGAVLSRIVQRADPFGLVQRASEGRYVAESEVLVISGAVNVAVDGVDPEILRTDLLAGLAQPHRIDGDGGRRLRKEIEIGNRLQVGVNVPGIEQQALPDEAFVIGRIAVHADIRERVVNDCGGCLRDGFPGQDGFGFELGGGACDAPEAREEAE